MSYPVTNLENFQIPLAEIESAIIKFRRKARFVVGEYRPFYRGYLSESWENRKKNGTSVFKRFEERKEFLNELKVISILNNENFVPFLGYCDEGEVMFIVYDSPCNLYNYLCSSYGRRELTWQKRLEICLDAARGLNYLHSGGGHHGKVIHGCISSETIWLDEDLKARICGFEISEFIPGNQPCQQVYKPVYEDMEMYTHQDPIHVETGFLMVESDIYSFGVLLFCMLTRSEGFGEVMSKDGDCIPNSLTMLVQHHYHNRLDTLVDPHIRDQIDGPSFRMIEEITCKCLSYDIKDRPTTETLIKTIEGALAILNQEKAISGEGSRGEYRHPRNFYWDVRDLFEGLIIDWDLDRLNIKGNNSLPPCINSEVSTPILRLNKIPSCFTLKIYNNNEVSLKMFNNEAEILSRFHHENIIPFHGYSDHRGQHFLICDHAINGSLRDHLQDPDKLCCIAWEQRLKICLGAARGLECLHSGLWNENRSVVHRHVRSENILLDENMEAKISGFGLSIFVPRNKPQVSDNNWELLQDVVHKDIIDDFKASMDPIYRQSNIVNTKVDVYSFGLVMFEILSGSVLERNCNYREKPDLIIRVHRHYGDNEMEKLIDPNIRDQFDGRSFQIFAETAYRCLSYNIKERPSMNRIIKKIEEALYFQKHRATDSTTTIRSLQFQKLEDLRIPLKEIKLATSDFHKTSEIGKGAFGVVYKGRLSESWTKHEAAFKRLKKTSDKEKREFLKELELISKFHHQNIIRLIGYCDDGDDMIFVSECAINGSLDDHLEKPEKMRLLTWNKRLKICLGAAKGLEYLHSGLGEANKVIHRDVKSGNILLDDNLEAKICDFGLSKSGLTSDHQHSKHYTRVAGTDYYMDPVYHESGILRAESDVYSFGVVMFEMLSGLPAYGQRRIGDDQPRPLLNLVRRYYDYGKELLIDPKIKDKDQIDSNSFRTFIEIAYQCISFNSKERPSMETIVDKIEEALDFQEKKEGLKQS